VTRFEIDSDTWRKRLARAGLPDLRALLREQPPIGPAWRPLPKPGLHGRQRWRWEFRNGSADCVLFVKRYTRPDWRTQWDRLLRQSPRRSRAAWEYHQARRLAKARIAAPQPVAYVECMLGHLEVSSAVLMEAVPGQPLDRALAEAFAQRAPITVGAARHDLAKRLGRFVAAFHATGLCHRDLYLCHIFVDWDTQGRRPPAFAVIDLARTHRPRWRRLRWIIKDLAQLDASARQVGATRTDRYRTLLAYLGLPPRSPRAHQYARRILRKSDWILRREARKGRR